jgi:histidine decarboxylase
MKPKNNKNSMLTRRRFLGYSGTNMSSASTDCRPHNQNWLYNHEEIPSINDPSLAAKAELGDQKNLFLGYPINMNTPVGEFFAWRRQLHEAGIGSSAFNNAGNPFKQNAVPYDTHDFERDVIFRFGELLGFSLSDIWGFLSNSGTDSNMHGMYMGRTILKGRTGVVPKAYFTKEAHYSIQILRDLLGLDTVVVETLPDGSMDPKDLKLKLANHSNYPALVVATIGTTFKGAIDQVDGIQAVLEGHPSYLHLDAALFGGYLPYTEHASEVLHRIESSPTIERYDSIAVSCHKFFGFPSPAGLFITTENRFNEFSEGFGQVHNPEYIQHIPGTISCSRDAVKPAEFYFFSTPSAMARQAEDAHLILQLTTYLLQQMQTHFAYLLATRANDRSNTIYFRKPSNRIVEKYSLATMQLVQNNQRQDYAHVVVMPHVNQKVLTEFLTDLEKDSDAFL